MEQKERPKKKQGYSGSVHRGISSASSVYSSVYSVPPPPPPHGSSSVPTLPPTHVVAVPPGMPMHVVPSLGLHHGAIHAAPPPHAPHAHHASSAVAPLVATVPPPPPPPPHAPHAHVAAATPAVAHPYANYHMSYMQVSSIYGDYCELCAKSMQRKVRKLELWGVTNLAAPHPSYTPMQTVELYYRHYKKKHGKPVSATKNARSSRNSDSDYFGNNTCASSSTTTLADRERLDRPEAPLPPGAYAADGTSNDPPAEAQMPPSREQDELREPSPKALPSSHSPSPSPTVPAHS